MTSSLVMGVAGLASGWMLLWTAAAAIPIVLHLLNRRRQQTVSWAAMRLLLQAIEKQSKRIRFEHLILLAIRTLILLTLACALARPYFTPEDSSGTVAVQRAPRLWILAIDNSYSMGFREENGTRFTAAQARAIDVVQQAVRGDAFALLTLSQPSQPVISRPTFERESTIEAVRRIELLDGGADLDSGLNHIRETIAEAKQDKSLPSTVEIILFSDFGIDTWQEALGSGRLVRPLTQLAEAHTVTFESFAGEELANAAVVSLAPASTRALTDQLLDVEVTVSNFGQAALSQLPVQLQVDGHTVESQLVDLPPGASRVVHMQLRPRFTGLLKLSASVREDRLPADDRRFAIVEVRDVYRVLCAENAFSEAKILKSALQPKVTTGSPLEVTSIPQIELSTTELENFDALVLNDLPGVSEFEFQRLRAFAAAGRSIIALLGKNTVATNWNPFLESKDDLFGFHLLEPSSVSDWKIDPLQYASPIVSPFAAYPDAGLLTTPIFRYWKIQSHGTQERQLISEVALHEGGPLIVSFARNGSLTASLLSAPQTGSSMGEGQAWNAMAAWPSFVPLLQQMVKTTLSHSAKNYNLSVGQTITNTVRATEQALQVHLIRPDGRELTTQTSEIDAAGKSQWSFPQIMRSGIYQVKADGQPLLLFAVNIDPVQSDLQSVPIEQLPRSSDKVGEVLTAAPEDAAMQPSQTLTSAILVALASLLIVETLLAWHLGRRL